MLSETQLAALPLPLQQHFRELETSIISRICSHIGKIGALTATDIYKLNELRNIGYDMQAIQFELARKIPNLRFVDFSASSKDIADTLNKSTSEIHDLFSKSAKMEYNSIDLSAPAMPFRENVQLQSLIQSVGRATVSKFKNMCNTSAMGLITRTGNVQAISTAYQSAIDYASIQIRTGQIDFYGAIRQTVKNLSDGGARVMYESGNTRRLDSAARW